MTALPDRFRLHTDGSTARPVRNWALLCAWVAGVLGVLLGAVCVASVLNQRVHDAVYAVVAPVARSIYGEQCLQESPTESRRRAVGAATAELAEEHARLQREHRVLEAAAWTLVGATDLLIKKHDKVKTSARAVSHRIAARVARGAARKPASAVGQAVPIVGVALVWGMASLDLYEACDAMKDLAELDRAIDGSSAGDAQKVCGLRVPTKSEIADLLSSGWRDAYQAAANAINGDGRVKVPAEATKPSDAQAKGHFCRVFGC